jgi:hypothetical protein
VVGGIYRFEEFGRVGDFFNSKFFCDTTYKS